MIKKYQIFADNLQIDLYKVILNIQCGNSVFECFHATNQLNYHRRFYTDNELKSMNGIFTVNENTNNWIVSFNLNKLTHSLIAHEAFHATLAIMKQKGCKLTEESEEAYAYLLDYIVQEITKMLAGYIKKG